MVILTSWVCIGILIIRVINYVGADSSFVPPLVYAVFGSSKHLAVGTVAACSLLIAEIIGEVASPEEDPTLYLHLVLTATLITGVMQTALGLLRCDPINPFFFLL